MWFIITRFLYSHMSFLYVTWSSNLLKFHSATSKKTMTTRLWLWQLCGNIYRNEMTAYLDMTWPNHAEVINATGPKVALMKGTYLIRSRDVWLYTILKNERAYETFTKAVRHQISWRETQKTIHLLFKFKICVINVAPWSELKLLCG